MNRTMIRLIYAVTIAFLALSIASCADATGWYPDGTATVVGSYEYEEAGIRSIVVTVTLENTGTSTISRSTFTIRAATEVRTYWKTVTSETRILPGTKVKVSSVIAYAEAAETLAQGGLTVGDAFFE